MTRLPTKALAIASNYGMTSVSQGDSGDRVPINFSPPTVQDGVDIAILDMPSLPGGSGIFDLHSLSIVCQSPATEAITFNLYQSGTPDVDLSGQVQLVLPAGEHTAEVAGDPLQAGLDRSKVYFLRCVASEGVYAQGLTITYTVGGF